MASSSLVYVVLPAPAAPAARSSSAIPKVVLSLPPKFFEYIFVNLWSTLRDETNVKLDLTLSCCSDRRVFLAAATAVDVDVGEHPAVVDGRRVHLPVATGERPPVEG